VNRHGGARQVEVVRVADRDSASVTAAPKSPSRPKACSSWPAYIGTWASRARPHSATTPLTSPVARGWLMTGRSRLTRRAGLLQARYEMAP
jgi:hypothetical protein